MTSPREKIAPQKKRVSYFSPLQLACFPVDTDIHVVPSTTRSWPASEDSHSNVSVKSNDPPPPSSVPLQSASHPSPVTDWLQGCRSVWRCDAACSTETTLVPFIWPEVKGRGHPVKTHTKQSVCGGGAVSFDLCQHVPHLLLFGFCIKKCNLFVSS